MKWFYRVVLFILLLSIVSFADVPHIISYQGMLTDTKSSEPLIGNHDISFKLYTSLDGFDEIWTETHSDVLVDNGLFAVMLGSVNPFGVDFSEQYWLEVTVDGNVLKPRFRLGASPYALNIPDALVFADIQDATGESQFTVTNGDHGLRIKGTGTVDIDFDEDDHTITIDVPQYRPPGGNQPVRGTGTANYVAKWTGTREIGNSQLFDDGVNVGIGTASPIQKLDIAGNCVSDTFFGDGSQLTGIETNWDTLGAYLDTTVDISVNWDTLGAYWDTMTNVIGSHTNYIDTIFANNLIGYPSVQFLKGTSFFAGDSFEVVIATTAAPASTLWAHPLSRWISPADDTLQIVSISEKDSAVYLYTPGEISILSGNGIKLQCYGNKENWIAEIGGYCEIEDSLHINGNCKADTFIGDGSQLTGIETNWDTLGAYWDKTNQFNYFTQDSIDWDTLNAYPDTSIVYDTLFAYWDTTNQFSNFKQDSINWDTLGAYLDTTFSFPMDDNWTISTSIGNGTDDTTLVMGGKWGLFRDGNIAYGNVCSTHVNLGVAGQTGTIYENYKYCTVVGGYNNTASNFFSTIGGGGWNITSGYAGTIGGGLFNTASGPRSTVGGGYENTARDEYATVGGGYGNNASSIKSTIGGGSLNTAGWSATVGGGGGNTASGRFSIIGGGSGNTASDRYATIGGGLLNIAGNTYSTIGGGYSNAATGHYATISGGYDNIAIYHYSTVGGGHHNTASGWSSTVSGGYTNTANGIYSGIAWGKENETYACYSFAGGYHSVVHGDSTDTASMALGTGVVESVPYAFVIGDGDDTLRTGHTILLGMDTKVDGAITADTFFGTFSGSLSNLSLQSAYDGGGEIIMDTTKHNIRIRNNIGDEILYLDRKSSYIGIGDTMPEYKLDVDGDCKANTFVGVHYGEVQIPNGNKLLITDSSGADSFSIFDDGDTTHIHSDNPIKFGDSTFIIDAPENVVLAHNCDIRISSSEGSPYGSLIIGGEGTSGGYLYLKRGIIDYTDGIVRAGNAGDVLVTTGVLPDMTADVYWANASDVAHGDNCAHWTRGTGDDENVVFTGDCSKEFLAIAKGHPTNYLYADADNKRTHVNLGGNSQTGVDGNDFKYCTISGGENNIAAHDYATIGGGLYNRADSFWTIISGGDSNSVYGNWGTIGGGHQNTIRNVSRYCTIAGGASNEIHGGGWIKPTLGATIGGGGFNVILATTGLGPVPTPAIGLKYPTIGGGESDTVKCHWGSVLSGYSNVAGNSCGDIAAVVAGGYDNSSLAKLTYIGGGDSNYVSGEYGTIGGGHIDTVFAKYGGVFSGRNNLAGDEYSDSCSFVGGGANNRSIDLYSTICGGYGNVDNSGYGFIGGGENNIINLHNETSHSTIGGGKNNTTIGIYTGICTGYNNQAGNGLVGDTAAFVGGGSDNKAISQYAAVCGGRYNTATGLNAMIGGGGGNYTSPASHYSYIGGGKQDSIDAIYSVIPGGRKNIVNGKFSYAFGNEVVVNSDFVVSFFKNRTYTLIDTFVQEHFTYIETTYVRPGKVGINNPNPYEALHVVGNTIISADIEIGDDAVIDDNLDVGGDAEVDGKVTINDILHIEPREDEPYGVAGDIYVRLIPGTPDIILIYFHNGDDWKQIDLIP